MVNSLLPLVLGRYGFPVTFAAKPFKAVEIRKIFEIPDPSKYDNQDILRCGAVCTYVHIGLKRTRSVLEKIYRIYYALADLGGMPGTCHPLWDQILSFLHTFSPKSARIRGPHPPPTGARPPPTGNPGSATAMGHCFP